MKKKKIEEVKRQFEQAKKDKADFKEFWTELENLEEGKQELIKAIFGKIYEALKESDVMAFASTPACVDIGEEILKAAYHISNLTWRHAK
jgi:serine/threonine protein phosphatase PrpC